MSAKYTLIRKLEENRHFTLYRGSDPSKNVPVLLKVFTQKSPAALHAYQQESSLAPEFFKVNGVSAVIDETEIETYPTLVFLDFGGESLAHLYLSPGAPKLSRAVAIEIFYQASLALLAVHKRDIIHNGISPESIAYNPQTNALKIIDLGTSAKSSRHLYSVATAQFFASSLEYISPEQTGRVNRPIDYRTDIYSLGVTMYHLLAGFAPFSANDPLELLHLLITKRATPLHEIDETIPLMLSRIVARCMEKNAEDRYQSAYGLNQDIKRCLEATETLGAIQSFKLAQRDFSPKFHIPNKLFGHENELELIVHAFKDMVKIAEPRILFVSGPSGVGKSHLVNEIQKPVSAERGYYVAGKFSEFQRNVPFSALIDALNELTHYLLFENKKTSLRIKNDLKERVGGYQQILSELIPDIKELLGHNLVKSNFAPAERQEVYHTAILRFLEVVATAEHPLVLFLDDLQWADQASLDFIHFLSKSKRGYILLIGSYRALDIDPLHQLSFLLESTKNNSNVQSIEVSPLSVENIRSLLEESLHLRQDEIIDLSGIVFKKTNGNPLFINQMLFSLHKEGLIKFNFDEQHWELEMEGIRLYQISDKIVDFMVDKIKFYPDSTQEVLRIASILGSTYEPDVIALLVHKESAQIKSMLWQAEQDGLIVCLDNTYKFEHDKIQEAVYESIPSDLKDQLHFLVGNFLLHHREKSTQGFFTIANHLNRGGSRIDSEQKKRDLIRINLESGIKAKESSAYVSAVSFLQKADDLGSSLSWDLEYDEMRLIRLHLIESLYLLRRHDEGDLLLSQTLPKLRSDFDRARFMRFRLQALAISNQLDECIEVGIQALRLMGVRIRRNSSMVDLVANLAKVKWALHGQGPKVLDSIPECTDPQIKLIISLFSDLGSSAFILGEANFFTVNILKMLELSIRWGYSPEASMAIAGYALLCNGVFENFGDALGFGRAAVDINERLNDRTYRCKVTDIYANWAAPFCTRFADIYELYRNSLQIGMETHDFIYAGYAIANIAALRFVHGTGVDQGIEEAQKAVTFATERGQMDMVYFAGSYLKYFEALRDGFYNIASWELFPKGESDFHEKAPPIAKKVYHAVLADLALRLGDYDEAYARSKKAISYVDASMGTIDNYPVFMNAFISAATTCRNGKELRYKQRLMRKILKSMQARADTFPDNFLHFVKVMQAENFNLEGKATKAIATYQSALMLAEKQGFNAVCALAHSRLRDLWSRRDFGAYARFHNDQAIQFYKKMGAHGLASQLSKRYPQAESEQLPAAQLEHDTFENIFDIQSLLKSANTLSSEIVVENLLRKMMQIIAEAAGANYAHLLLDAHGNGELKIEASLNLDGSIDTLKSLNLSSDLICESIVNGVMILKREAIVDDATHDPHLAHDPYVKKTQPKSMLCLPVIRQSEMLGVLYLENTNSTSFFTENRVKLLLMLSSQAAISLQNALLYQDLSRANAELQDYAFVVSHDLQTPMRTISSFSALAMESASQEERKKLAPYFEFILQGTREMRSLIENLVTYTNIGHEPEAMVNVDLNDIVKEHVFSMSKLPDYPEFSIDPLPRVRGQRSELSRLFHHLLQNAYIFRKEDAVLKVRISAKEMPSFWEISVTDNGGGIGPEDLSQVFQLFKKFHKGQASDQANREQGIGTGVGLAICKKVVEFHGGKIWVSSQSGAGSTFYFTLPKDLHLPH